MTDAEDHTQETGHDRNELRAFVNHTERHRIELRAGTCDCQQLVGGLRSGETSLWGKAHDRTKKNVVAIQLEATVMFDGRPVNQHKINWQSKYRAIHAQPD